MTRSFDCEHCEQQFNKGYAAAMTDVLKAVTPLGERVVRQMQPRLIVDVTMSKGLRNVLKAANLRLVETLYQMSRQELKAMPGMGPKRYAELNKVLQMHGHRQLPNIIW